MTLSREPHDHLQPVQLCELTPKRRLNIAMAISISDGALFFYTSTLVYGQGEPTVLYIL